MLIPEHDNGQSTLLSYCCQDVKSHRSGGDTVPLTLCKQVDHAHGSGTARVSRHGFSKTIYLKKL